MGRKKEQSKVEEQPELELSLAEFSRLIIPERYFGGLKISTPNYPYTYSSEAVAEYHRNFHCEISGGSREEFQMGLLKLAKTLIIQACKLGPVTFSDDIMEIYEEAAKK